MAIKFNDVLLSGEKNKINFEMVRNEILGIINFDFDDIFEKDILLGKVSINKYVLNDKSTNAKKEQLRDLISSNSDNDFKELYVKDEIKSRLSMDKLTKLDEYLKLFDLNDSILDRMIVTLSPSEKNKILLICTLLTDKEIIYLNDPTNDLDDYVKEKLIIKLKKIKREKIIAIKSTDTDFLVKIANFIFLKTKDCKFIYQNKYEILSNEKILNDINLLVPNILKFINSVYKLKGIKLGFRDNINDTVKDVYRHV